MATILDSAHWECFHQSGKLAWENCGHPGMSLLALPVSNAAWIMMATIVEEGKLVHMRVCVAVLYGYW